MIFKYNIQNLKGFIIFKRSNKTAISIRYEEYNVSDLVIGNNQRFSMALAYQIDGFNSMIKAQWTQFHLKSNHHLGQ